ncbi:hypothetical protein DIURU_000169 [Diutina rugosa]|uniref:Cystathionine gamma-synthase n=1 Tax=Diutina rugosa TaxID=5481 RepID=A0A642UZI0_DIURU|nr:uncharacterized protein DIURU_000169 [Diutina rugosa]KAA8908626.1 hypothetical protein DIURU_000169 [Diutina rugosa]
MTGLSTRGVHGADDLSRVPDVVPPINVATTFKYSKDPSTWMKAADDPPILNNPVYSRESHPNSEQVEAIVEQITGYKCVVYSSGLSAFNAAMCLLNPKTLAIGQAYHGCHGIADILTRNYGVKQIGLDDEFEGVVKSGDVVHLESPVNPEGVCIDIQKYADKAHKYGAKVVVDSTFAPPPIQDPFQQGADIVMHSATKFFGGHSDLLAGLLLVKDDETKDKLLKDRLLLGTNIANLEASLLIRSLRTFEMRVDRQWKSATAIVKRLHDDIDKLPKLAKIYHSSLQTEPFVAKQMPNGHSPVFSIECPDEQTAKELPLKLKYFIHATSLGGVESLIEWRALSDATCSTKLLRISVGVENVEDLIEDLVQALQ